MRRAAAAIALIGLIGCIATGEDPNDTSDAGLFPDEEDGGQDLDPPDVGSGVDAVLGAPDAASCEADPSCPSGTRCGAECLCTTDNWLGFARGVLRTKCGSCHAVWVGDYNRVSRLKLDMQRRVSSGDMPRGGIVLTAEERTRLLRWLSCGLPR